MKLPVKNISTETSQMLSEQSFGFGDIGLIFDILRSKLYKDPVVAICREYTSNARDAHREAGTPDRPIEVYLPNAFDPHYKVKDYGPGITPDRMDKVFVKYASSTKRDDNVQTGAFGIGAKSAFSYTDTFTIVTVTDGTKRTYNAYIDETQVGKMALGSASSTDEPNGTTIIVPILKPDFTRFLHATMMFTEYWNPLPILFGVSPTPVYDEKSVIIEGSNWKLLNRKLVSSYNTCSKNAYKQSIALIDGIPYVIDENFIKGLAYDHKTLIANDFILDFGNGELSLAASRDSIHYDDKTQALLLSRIKDLQKSVIDVLKDKIKSCASFKEACKVAQVVSHKIGNGIGKSSDLTWNGTPVILSWNTRSDIGRWGKISTYTNNGGNIGVERYRHSLPLSFDAKLYRNDRSQENVPKELVKYIFSIRPDEKHIQIISTPEKPNSRSFRKDDKKPEYNETILKLLELENLSGINMPRQKRVPKVKPVVSGTIHGYAITNRYYRHRFTYNAEDIDNAAGGIYVEVDCRNTNAVKSGSMIITDYSNFVMLRTKLGNIKGFSKPKIAKLGPNWVKLCDAIQAKLTELEKDISRDALIESVKSVDYVLARSFPGIGEGKDLIKSIVAKDSLFVKYFEASKKVSDDVTKYADTITILRMLGLIKQSVFKSDLYTLLIDVQAKYPMLDYATLSYKDNYLKSVYDYINLIDRLKK